MKNVFIREIENIQTKEELLYKKESYLDYLKGLENLIKEEKGLQAETTRIEISNVQQYLEMIDKKLEEK